MKRDTETQLKSARSFWATVEKFYRSLLSHSVEKRLRNTAKVSEKSLSYYETFSRSLLPHPVEKRHRDTAKVERSL